MSDEPVEILWKQVLEGWGEEKRHQAFIGYCHERGLLADAARLYRTMVEDGEAGPYRSTAGQREDAKKRLQAIMLLALAHIEAGPRQDPVNVRKWLNITALSLFFITLGFLVWALTRMQGVTTE